MGTIIICSDRVVALRRSEYALYPGIDVYPNPS